MKNSSINMTSGPLLKNMIAYTIPIILTGVLQLAFNAADLMVVGRFCGSISVAAVGATTSIINLITNLFIGLSVGAGVSVAHAIGAGKSEEQHKIVHTAIPAAFISGVILTIIGVLCARTFLSLMKTPEDVIGLSALYMKIYFCGMVSTMIYNFGSAILRAAGNTKGPLVYLTLAGVVNVCLNLVFVMVFNMNVAGVALATALSQTLAAVLVVLALMKRTDDCKLDLRKMYIHKKPLGKMVRIGVPAGIQGSLFAVSNVIIQSAFNSFGTAAISGGAAAGNIEGFSFVAMNAVHQAALNFSGQNMGAKKFDRVSKTMWVGMGIVTVLGIALGIFTVAFARPLLGIFITDSAEAIELGVVRLTYICLPYFICGLMDVSAGVIRGMGSSLAPTVITVLGVCGVRLTWIYTLFRLPQFHTLESLYIAYIVSWVVTWVAQMVLYFVLKKKLNMQAVEITA